MKLAPLALIAALAVGGGALAHEPGAHHHGERLDRLATQLQLDDTQKAQVQRIFEEQRTRMQSERQQHEASGTRPTREEMKARREQSRAELRQQLGGVLSAEQLTKFDELMKNRKHRGDHRPHDSADTQ